MEAVAEVQEVQQMVLTELTPLQAALVAMERRSLPESLGFQVTWGPIPSAAAVAAVDLLLVAPEAVVAAVLALPLTEQQARVVLAVVVVAQAVAAGPAGPAEPAAWRFNMPTTAM
jgi:hypothetical protein